jgi:hypothetical protein
MIHLDEGAILMARDGALVSADAELHLRDCPECTDRLVLARQRSDRVSQLLGALDIQVDVAAAKARARASMDRDATRATRILSVRHLSRAAALLLLAAGAAYAVPGSPFRQWVESTTQSSTIGTTIVTPDAQEFRTGIDVPVVDGRIRIALNSVGEGAHVEVVWIADAVARISGSEGSTYSVSRGVAEADVRGSRVRLALPRNAAAITVEVNGRVILRQSESGLDVLGEVVDQSDDRIVFSVTSG